MPDGDAGHPQQALLPRGGLSRKASTLCVHSPRPRCQRPEMLACSRIGMFPAGNSSLDPEAATARLTLKIEIPPTRSFTSARRGDHRIGYGVDPESSVRDHLFGVVTPVVETSWIGSDTGDAVRHCDAWCSAHAGQHGRGDSAWMGTGLLITQRSRVQIPPPLLISAGQGHQQQPSAAAWQRDGGDGVARDETAWTWWTLPPAIAGCLAHRYRKCIPVSSHSCWNTRNMRNPGLGQGRQRLVVASGCQEPEIRPCSSPITASRDAAGADATVYFLERALPAPWVCPGSPRV